MPEADPNQTLINARANLKDTAKWIVTILGATIVLVIGGGLIVKIADLDLTQRLFATGCLFVLMLLCLVPLTAAIDIIATKLESFQYIATSAEYDAPRQIVNRWLEQVDSGDLSSVDGRYREFVRQIQIRIDPNSTDAAKQAANRRLGELQPRISEAIQLSNTEYLRLKFDRMLASTKRVLPGIALALALFFTVIHSGGDQTEKQLARPLPIQIDWSQNLEAALKKAGLEEKCYLSSRPQFLQVSEKSGLRAGVLVIPKDIGPACPAVRVVVTSDKQVYPDI